MNVDSTTKKVFKAQPIGTQRRGKTNLRWIDGLEKDLLVLRTRNWRTLARKSLPWKRLLEKAKAHPGVSCLSGRKNIRLLRTPSFLRRNLQCTSVAQQPTRTRAYCAHPSIRDHWVLRCMGRCPDQVGQFEARPPVLNFPGKLDTHLSTHCSGDESSPNSHAPETDASVVSAEYSRLNGVYSDPIPCTHPSCSQEDPNTSDLIILVLCLDLSVLLRRTVNPSSAMWPRYEHGITPLRVKEDIEDVSSELGNGVTGCTSWMKRPELYCSRQIVRVQYFVRRRVRWPPLACKFKASLLSSSGRRARFLGGHKGVALQVQDAHVGVGSNKRCRLDVDIRRSDVTVPYWGYLSIITTVFGTLYETKSRVANSVHATHAKLGLPTWPVIFNVGIVVIICKYRLLVIEIVK
ncbi:uncharacterized protein TNCV_1710211 [Trichonephila clavipes]|nr:uncharacterized protein TNCV_1710211 [Trichonephila clavipes]